MNDGELVRDLDLPGIVTAIMAVMIEIGLLQRVEAKKRRRNSVMPTTAQAPASAANARPAVGRGRGVGKDRGSGSNGAAAASSPSSPSQAFVGSSVAFYGMHLLVGCLLSRSDCLLAMVSFPYFRQWLKYYTLQVCVDGRGGGGGRGSVRRCVYFAYFRGCCPITTLEG